MLTADDFHVFHVDAADHGNNPQVAAIMLLDRIRDVLSRLGGLLPPRDEFERLAEKIFDEYIGPFDLPFVPNLAEPMVDRRLVRPLWVWLAMGVYDRVSMGS